MNTLDALGTRIVVVGTSGSGKSTLARQLADLTHSKYIEMDNLHWLPNWVERETDELRQLVQAEIACEEWVLDGNYSSCRDIVWPQAQTLIWLDYPLRLIMGRLLWRTLRRTLTQEKLWTAENRERLWPQFFSRDSLFLWALQSHQRRHQTYLAALMEPAHQHLNVLRFYHPRETQQWLDGLAQR